MTEEEGAAFRMTEWELFGMTGGRDAAFGMAGEGCCARDGGERAQRLEWQGWGFSVVAGDAGRDDGGDVGLDIGLEVCFSVILP